MTSGNAAPPPSLNRDASCARPPAFCIFFCCVRHQALNQELLSVNLGGQNPGNVCERVSSVSFMIYSSSALFSVGNQLPVPAVSVSWCHTDVFRQTLAVGPRLFNGVPRRQGTSQGNSCPAVHPDRTCNSALSYLFVYFCASIHPVVFIRTLLQNAGQY